MSKKVKIVVLDIFEIGVGLAVFALGLWLFLMMACGQVGASDICERTGPLVPEIDSAAMYYDSHGAEAYGWELNEAMRLMMLECGSYKVSEADKREHCAVLCKQLLYTQVVGGYNGWGTSLWGVMHASNTYLQTAPRIWNEEAEPTDEIKALFWDVWRNGYLSDFRVQSYRLDYHFADYYTAGGDWAINAYSIGSTYYSRNYWQDFSMFDLDENGVLGYSEWEPVEMDWFRPEEALVMYDR